MYLEGLRTQTGRLLKLATQNAGGASTCYLTLDRECKNVLVVNYWNATIGVFGVDGKQGHVTDLRFSYDPYEGRPMKAQHDRHVNHSENDGSLQKERQSDPTRTQSSSIPTSVASHMCPTWAWTSSDSSCTIRRRAR